MMLVNDLNPTYVLAGETVKRFMIVLNARFPSVLHSEINFQEEGWYYCTVGSILITKTIFPGKYNFYFWKFWDPRNQYRKLLKFDCHV